MMTDREARERIVSPESLDRNLFLNAGAGSGKTESLVRRVLTLIKHGTAMDSIVAITFTKEAARMFYDRIGRELKKAATEAADRGAGEEAERLNEALRSIDQAFFGTIDSFCRKLLMEHPQEAGISSRFVPLEREAEQQAFCMELFTAMQRTQTPKSLWEQYDELRGYGIGTGDFQQMIMTGWSASSFTMEPGPKPDDLVIDPAEYAECEKEAQWLMNFLEECFLGETASCTPFSKANEETFRKIKRTLRIEEKVAAYRVVAALNEFVEGLPKTKQKKELSAMASSNARLKAGLETLERLAQRAEVVLTAFGKEKYYKSILFIEAFCTYVQEQMEDRGLATFDSCLLAAVKMLRMDARQGGALTAYIQNRYRRFLVDEYQDTSSLQSELFFRLAAETPDEDWKRIRLRPGVLFIVGDEKQAIYRFRGGDVDNYNAVRKRFEEDDACEVLQLSCNFRSSAPMTQWFNQVFSADRFLGTSFPQIEPSEKQKRFGEQSGTVDGVYRYPVIAKKRGNRNSPSIEGNENDQILTLIRDLLTKEIFSYNHVAQSTTKRPITYSDIMIITANKGSLRNYIQLLAKHGIPYSVAGNSRLAENPVLPMMERLLDAAIHPGDTFRTYGCLMQPPFSLTESEIYRWKNEGKGTAAGKAFAMLEDTAYRVRRETPSALFQHLLYQLKSWRWLDPVCGDSMDTLYYGLELVRAEEAAGKLRNGDELLRFIGEQLRGGGYEYEMATEERSRGIKLLNLHKSKGLEAPVVILADAAMPAEYKVNLCLDFQTRKAYVASITKRSEFGKKANEIVSTDQFQTETGAEEEQLRREKIRLRYVAATRAENVLLIPQLHENIGDNGVPVAGDITDGRWDDFITASPQPIPLYAFTGTKGTTAADTDDGDDGDTMVVKPFRGEFSAERSYGTLNPSKVQCRTCVEGEATEGETGVKAAPPANDVDSFEPVKSMGADGAEEVPLVRTREEWKSVPATVLGTAVHRLMQAMVDRRCQTADADRWQSVARAIALEEDVAAEDRTAVADCLGAVASAMSSGGYAQTLDGAETAAYPWIPRTVPGDLLRELADAEEVYTELPFSLYLPAQSPLLQELARTLVIDADADGYLNGIMDLIYCKAGVWYICDYKTNEKRAGLYKHYEGQLLLYREIARQLLGLKELPQAYLYHIPCKTT